MFLGGLLCTTITAMDSWHILWSLDMFKKEMMAISQDCYRKRYLARYLDWVNFKDGFFLMEYNGNINIIILNK